MIQIEGTVRGDVSDVCFEPTKPRFKGPSGEVIVAAPIHATIIPEGSDWRIKATLPDNTELTSPTRWMYLCYEYSQQGTEMFTLTSDPATYQYADVRPRRRR